MSVKFHIGRFLDEFAESAHKLTPVIFLKIRKCLFMVVVAKSGRIRHLFFRVEDFRFLEDDCIRIVIINVQHTLIESLHDHIKSFRLLITAQKRIGTFRSYIIVTHGIKKIIAKFVPHKCLVDITGVQNPATIGRQTAKRLFLVQFHRIGMLVELGGSAAPAFDLSRPYHRITARHHGHITRNTLVPRNLFIRKNMDNRQLQIIRFRRRSAFAGISKNGKHNHQQYYIYFLHFTT